MSCLASMEQIDISIDDFERIIEPNSKQRVLRLKVDAATRKGLTFFEETNFQTMMDRITGQSILYVKHDQRYAMDNRRAEIVTDITTNKQTICMMFNVDDNNERINRRKSLVN
jgi:hypothetical protein